MIQAKDLLTTSGNIPYHYNNVIEFNCSERLKEYGFNYESFPQDTVENKIALLEAFKSAYRRSQEYKCPKFNTLDISAVHMLARELSRFRGMGTLEKPGKFLNYVFPELTITDEVLAKRRAARRKELEDKIKLLEEKLRTTKARLKALHDSGPKVTK